MKAQGWLKGLVIGAVLCISLSTAVAQAASFMFVEDDNVLVEYLSIGGMETYGYWHIIDPDDFFDLDTFLPITIADGVPIDIQSASWELPLYDIVPAGGITISATLDGQPLGNLTILDSDPNLDSQVWAIPEIGAAAFDLLEDREGQVWIEITGNPGASLNLGSAPSLTGTGVVVPEPLSLLLFGSGLLGLGTWKKRRTTNEAHQLS